MRDFIEFLIKSIVTKPEDVAVEEKLEGTVSDIAITVNQEDMGLVIGKGGKTIQSLRSLAKAKAIKEGVKVYVHVND